MSEMNPEAAAQLEALARRVAREEIASLAGLMLRRIQDSGPTVPPAQMLQNSLVSAFAEALHDFGATEEEPGDA